MKISFKGRLDPGLVIIGFLNGRSGCATPRDVVCRSSLVQAGIRLRPLHTGQVRSNDIGGFLGSCHVRDPDHLDVATTESSAGYALDHLPQALPGIICLLSSKRGQLSIFVELFSLVILSMSNENDVPCNSLLSQLAFATTIFVLVARGDGFQSVPIGIPQGILYLE